MTGWGHYAVIADGAVLATGITQPLSPTVQLGEHHSGAWRIIGMAVHPRRRRQGLGALVLDTLLAHARRYRGRWVWCHARLDAAAFYRRHGFDESAAARVDPLARRQLLMSRQL